MVIPRNQDRTSVVYLSRQCTQSWTWLRQRWLWRGQILCGAGGGPMMRESCSRSREREERVDTETLVNWS